MSDFISLVNEFGDSFIERISNISSIEKLEDGVRIFWYDRKDEATGEITGEDYITSFTNVETVLIY